MISLAAAILATIPTATRPYAGTVEITGATFAYLEPPGTFNHSGTDIANGWAVWADDTGTITLAVPPEADTTVTIVRMVGPEPLEGPWARETFTIDLPVTRDHQIETAVRMWHESQRRLEAVNADFFEIADQLSRIQGVEP